MYRIKQYRPNLRKRYSKVKVRQWSNKPTDQGVEAALDSIAYEGKFALDEEITGLTVHTDDGKIRCIWIKCSRPQYTWDRGFNSFMVHYRPKKRNLLKPLAEREQEEHEYLLNFLKVADKYFKENELNVEVEIFDDFELKEKTIEEIISSF